MKIQKFSVGLAAAALTLGLSSVWAQERARPANSETVGSAAPRGGGGDSAAPATASPRSGGEAATAGSPSSPANAPSSWMDPGSSRRVAPPAPVHPDRAAAFAADQRHGNGQPTGGRAVPRGESGGNASGSPDSASSRPSSESQPTRSRAVPEGSRPRDGRTQTGQATERTSPYIDRRGGYPVYSYFPSYAYDPFYSLYYSPYYSRYGYWNPWGYGYGLGYFSYDPYLFGALAYPGYYGGGGYSGYESSGGGSYLQHYQGAGSLRLKIKPENAQVYIDGYYVGVVDSFDGIFQKLNVDAGPHHVELRAEGYQTTDFDVVITPGDTITYKGEMKRH